MGGRTAIGAFAAAWLCAVSLAGAARADVMGTWHASGNALQIQIAPCGTALCGILLNSNRIRADPNVRDDKNKNPALRGRLLRGITMLQGFTGGPTKWSGNVYLPGDGQMHRAALILEDAETMTLKGCQGPFCMTQVFKRAK
jgi:uncharacterized protein (DUF2147 family)